MIYVPGVDGDMHTRAMSMPYLHSHTVSWDDAPFGSSKELFIYATTDEYNMEAEGFYGWLLQENGFLSVRGTWDGMLYVNKVSEAEILLHAGDERYRVMHNLVNAIETMMKCDYDYRWLTQDIRDDLPSASRAMLSGRYAHAEN